MYVFMVLIKIFHELFVRNGIIYNTIFKLKMLNKYNICRENKFNFSDNAET